MAGSLLPAIRPLTGADAAAYRALRLMALAAGPDAFTSSPEDEDGKISVHRLEGVEQIGGGAALACLPAGADGTHRPCKQRRAG